MSFVVIRHPEAGVGTCPEGVVNHFRANGWVRVSEPRSAPDDFLSLAEYVSAPDLDAPPAAPAKTKEPKA